MFCSKLKSSCRKRSLGAEKNYQVSSLCDTSIFLTLSYSLKSFRTTTANELLHIYLHTLTCLFCQCLPQTNAEIEPFWSPLSFETYFEWFHCVTKMWFRFFYLVPMVHYNLPRRWTTNLGQFSKQRLIFSSIWFLLNLFKA